MLIAPARPPVVDPVVNDSQPLLPELDVPVARVTEPETPADAEAACWARPQTGGPRQPIAGRGRLQESGGWRAYGGGLHLGGGCGRVGYHYRPGDSQHGPPGLGAGSRLAQGGGGGLGDPRPIPPVGPGGGSSHGCCDHVEQEARQLDGQQGRA